MDREWFADLAAVSNPGRKHVALLVAEVEDFLAFVITSKDFAVLWGSTEALYDVAVQTLETSLRPQGAALREAVALIPELALEHHGLSGDPFRLKLLTIRDRVVRWLEDRRVISVGEGFRRVLEAIDAPLDSALAAVSMTTAGAVGAVLKETKDAIGALVPTVDEAAFAPLNERPIYPGQIEYWVIEALQTLGGSGYRNQALARIFEQHGGEIASTEPLAFVWQVEVMNAVQRLRYRGLIAPAEGRRDLPWELTLP